MNSAESFVQGPDLQEPVGLPVILSTKEDGSIRAAAILQTQCELQVALNCSDPQAGGFARRTLVETDRGVRTMQALVTDLARYPAGDAAMALLIEQLRSRGLSTLAEGFSLASRCRSSA